MATELSACYRHPDQQAGVRCQRCERPICPSCMRQASVGFHCPDCARGGAQQVHTRRTLARSRTPVVTQSIIGLNVAAFLLSVAGGAGVTSAGSDFLTRYGTWGVAVDLDGEWWRLITGGFLHGGALHLLMNMFLLLLLGRELEPVLGRVAFTALYATSLLGGSLGVMLLEPEALTVGASGAVFGLMGGLAVAQAMRSINPWGSGIGGLILINVLITFTIPGISVGGHLGGLVAGAVSTALLFGLGDRTRQLWPGVAAVVALGAGLFVAALAAAERAVPLF